MALPSSGQMSNPPALPHAEPGTLTAPEAAQADAAPVRHFVPFRLALLLFAIVAGTEGYLTLQGAKALSQTLAGLLAFLAAALLIGTAIVFEPLHALFRRRE